MDPYRTGLNTIELLARGLEVAGDALDVRRLYDWLGVGLVSRSHDEDLSVLEGETGESAVGSVPRVRAWLTARPEMQKAIVLESLLRWVLTGVPLSGLVSKNASTGPTRRRIWAAGAWIRRSSPRVRAFPSAPSICSGVPCALWLTASATPASPASCCSNEPAAANWSSRFKACSPG